MSAYVRPGSIEPDLQVDGSEWALIDSHCHLDFPVFAPVRDQVIARARRAGVCQVVVPAVQAAFFQRQQQLQCRYPDFIHLAFGLHPCFRHTSDSLAALESLLNSGTAVAVGEIGLDFYHPQADRSGQMILLKAQLKLAKKHRLPVLLHVRKAHDEVLKMLRELQFSHGGIVHAFSGSVQQAQRYIERGFLLGVGGALSYDRAQRLRRVVSALPLTALALETDAPDMPLQGFQGQMNEPAQVARVFATLIQLRSETPAQVADTLQHNLQRCLALY